MTKKSRTILFSVLIVVFLFSLTFSQVGRAAPARYDLPTTYDISSAAGGITIEPITAYNLIVDSNVLSPSSYGPSAATLGAKFCNTSGGELKDVWAYIGNLDADGDGALLEAGDVTPGTYPMQDPAAFSLAGVTEVDFGDPTRFFALEHESGSVSDEVDASRFIGTLAAGECRTEYWLVSYPRKAKIAGGWQNVTGGIKPEDDLWLSYFMWATSETHSTPESYYWRPVTMRNEISAMANKIWPNGDNKVPDQYKLAIQDVLGWETWTPNGTGTTAYPGETVTSQGIWYDLGNVGAGFDNNYNYVPDRNAWVQPIGDATTYDPGCFRLVRTYGLVVVKLNDGTEKLIPFVDQMYFENIPENNTGAVGLVYYEYVALNGACTAGLTPYQEVASGYDNEKFNADFGAGIPPLQSRESSMTLDKTATTAVDPVTGKKVSLGGTIDYKLTFTLPDVDAAEDTMVVTVGAPSLGMPLVYYETIPDGLVYVAGSASSTVAMTNYSSPTVNATRLFSTDNGLTWSTDEPVPASLVTNIQWQLDEGIVSPKTGLATTGQVTFQAIVPLAYPLVIIDNTACLKLGAGPCFSEDTYTTLIKGSGTIIGHVWRDNGGTTGVLGNGVQEGDEAVISDGADTDTTGVTVSLCWDANGDGDCEDANDFIYDTVETSALTPDNYTFTNLPPTGAARYLIMVDTTDGDIPTGYGPTTATAYKQIEVVGTYGDAADGSEPSDFGFAPALEIKKSVVNTNPIVVGDTIDYLIALTNKLPGSGAAGSATCSYKLWAKEAYPDTTMTPPGGAANSRWSSTANAVGAPDEKYSYTDMTNSTNYVGISGYNLGNMGGKITGVQFIANLHERVNLLAGDKFEVQVYYNNLPVGAALYTYDGNGTVTAPATQVAFGGGTGTEYTIVETINPETVKGVGKTWEWSDFAGDPGVISLLDSLLEFQLVGRKGGGGTRGDLDLDGFGVIITTDQPCASDSGTLNPVPLVDTFNDDYFDFVSANPSVSSSDIGSLTWDNVGPIYPGQTRYIHVYMRATQAGASPETINTATSTNSKFANGLPANSPVFNTANVTIGVNAQTRTLSGVVFDDNNTNGWQTALWTQPGTGAGQTGMDAGDAGIRNIPVDLYACLNATTFAPISGVANNRTCVQEGGSWQYLQTVSTDVNGAYSFTNLRQGYYYVVVRSSVIAGSQTADVNQNGVCTTCDSRSNDPAQTSGTDDLEDLPGAVTPGFVGDLDDNTALTNVSFGYNIPAGVYNIGNQIFFDWDGNGAMNGPDEPIPGVTVRLLGPDGRQIESPITGSDGIYNFTGYPRAYYTVQVASGSLPAGVVQSYDPDSTRDNQSTFLLDMTYEDKDFGYKPVGSGSIGDTVFKDVNGNGTQEATEAGVAGVTVYLQVDWDGDGNYVTVTAQVTDADGKYLFTGLPVGVYRVVVDKTVDAALLPKDIYGGAYYPSTGTISGDLVYIPVTLTDADPSDLTADFGFAPPAAIGDRVYYDNNGDGVQQTTEPGINGVNVELYRYTDANGNGWLDPTESLVGAAVDSTTTANDPVTGEAGYYQFTGLQPGNYAVVVTPPANTTLTADPSADGEPCAGLTAGTICDGRDGRLFYNGTNYMGADFGFKPDGGMIGDLVWIDLDDDHLLSAGEVGVPYVTVWLCSDYACTILATTETDENGFYTFSGLADGLYFVKVNAFDADFPAGVAASWDGDGGAADNVVAAITINGGVVESIGGGACTDCDLNADLAYRYDLSGPNQIIGTVWYDPDDPQGQSGGVGEIGATELERYADAPVYLWWCEGGSCTPGNVHLVASTTTDAAGDYSFSGLLGEVYVVSLDAGAPSLIGAQQTTTTVYDGVTLFDAVASPLVDFGADPSPARRDFGFISNVDFGDLPDSYKNTAAANDGAKHVLVSSGQVYLGALPPDTEMSGPQAASVLVGGYETAAASGDDAAGSDDEDGVVILNAPWTVGEGGGSVQVVVGGATCTAANPCYLSAWFDWNRDGDMNDGGERILLDEALAAGTHTLTFDIPRSVLANNPDGNEMYLYARFRLYRSTTLGMAQPSGLATNGEVEDYRFPDPFPAALGDYIWFDEDGDGVQDVGETGIPNLTVTLSGTDAYGSAVNRTTVTDLDGRYLFKNVPAGDYTVSVGGLAAGLSPTYDYDGTGSAGSAAVTLRPNQEMLLADFGYNWAPTSDVTAGTGTGAIGDRLWIDMGADGLQGAGEAGLGGVTVNLLTAGADGLFGTADDVTAASTTTDAAGFYIFDGLAAGAYVVAVDESTLGTYTQTGDPDEGGPCADCDGQTTTPIVLAPGDVYLNADFGYIPDVGYGIGDVIFADLNGNGSLDGGDLGIPGVTVALKNAAGKVIATAITINGWYSFYVLPGDYTVWVNDVANVLGSLAQSSRPNNAADNGQACGGACSNQNTLTIAGSDNLFQDFGYTPAGQTSTEGLIGDTIFLDRDGDGFFFPGEGLEGVVVRLYNNTTGALLQTTVTDENGRYFFGNLSAATYSVRVDAATLPAGVTNTVDPDGGIVNRSIVTLAAGAVDLDQDFGYQPTVANTLSGTLWEDTDTDGTLGAETLRFGGVTVVLYDSKGNIVGATMTDGNGDYQFANLPDGEYRVDVTDDWELLNGYWHSDGPAADSDNNSQLDPYTVALAGGETNTTADFGYFLYPAAVGDFVWEDADSDGIQDAGELPLSGFEVRLTIDWLDGSATVLATTTDLNGLYRFGNLLLDENFDGVGAVADEPTFSLSVIPPSGYASTFLHVGGDASVDSDDPDGQAATVLKGQTDDTYDFGFVRPATFGDYVWLDENGDGVQDAGEPGIPNVIVELQDGVCVSTVDCLTTVTDNEGHYLFTNVKSGAYTVAVIDSSLPAGLAENPTYDLDGGLPHLADLTLAVGEKNLDVDFGYNWSAILDVTGNDGLGAIGDRIWIDADGDGVQDPGEAGLGGVAVDLLTAGPDGLFGTTDDVVEASTTTDAAGMYYFDALPAGAYVVRVNSGAAPGGYVSTGDPDEPGATCVVCDNQTTTPILLAPGDVYVNADFGYKPSAGYTIGNQVFVDVNGNGSFGAGEPGIAGVTVALKNAAGKVIATTVTDSAGQYSFPGLPNGTYTVWVNDVAHVLGALAQSSRPNNTADAGQVCGGACTNQNTLTIAGSSNTFQDFGYTPAGQTSTEGLIGDTIFLDRDGDSIADTGEGLAGVTVRLYNNTSGALLQTTVTNNNGSYFFGNLSAATYSVRVDTATLPGGLTNTVDPDGGVADRSTVTLAAGAVNLSQDFGYEPAAAANTISGTLWEDTDMDGTLGAETGRFAGVTVVLYDSNGNRVGATTTDANGAYQFVNLPDDTYRVDVTDDWGILNGYWHSDGAADGSDNNSQVDPYSVAVAAGATDSTGDFGYFLYPAAVGDFVWLDLDNDGVQDAGEPGIRGVLVVLTAVYPNGEMVALNTLSQADGAYEFGNLLLDENFSTSGTGVADVIYTIGVATPAGVAASPENATAAGNNDQVDGDSDGASEIATVLKGETDTSYDFGFYTTRFDLGDLPATYPTTFAASGAANAIFPDGGDNIPDAAGGIQAVWLGTVVDVEADGQASATASGDGLDEDSLAFASTGWVAGGSSTLTVILNGSASSVRVYYGVWIDWDNNGSFDAFYSGSRLTGSPVSESVTVSVPAGYVANSNVFIRVRAAAIPLVQMDSAGLLLNGETEDYLVSFGPTAITLTDFTAHSSQSWLWLAAAALLLGLSLAAGRAWRRREL